MAELTTLARPYAKAAYQVAKADGKLDMWESTLIAYQSALKESQMVKMLSGPGLNKEQKAELLAASLKGFDSKIQNFLTLLFNNKRMSLLDEIIHHFQNARSEEESSVRVTLTSSIKLSAADKNSLAASLKQKLGKDVEISEASDASLISGACVKVGDWVVESSAALQLRRLATHLNK